MATTSPSDEKELLATYLADRDVPCPRCGYNLRTLQSNHCPECGDEVELRVEVVNPRLGAVVVGLVGLALGAGCSGLLLIYAAINEMMSLHGYHGNFGRFIEQSLGINAIGFLIEGGALALGLMFWPRLHRLQVRTRRTLAISAWVLTAANIVVFSCIVR